MISNILNQTVLGKQYSCLDRSADHISHLILISDEFNVYLED